MRPVFEQLHHEGRVLLEVDALDRRVRRRAGPVRDHEREPIRERELRLPRASPVADTAVDEDEARPGPDGFDPHRHEHTKWAQSREKTDLELLQAQSRLLCWRRM